MATHACKSCQLPQGTRKSNGDPCEGMQPNTTHAIVLRVEFVLQKEKKKSYSNCRAVLEAEWESRKQRY